jgi:hypothetical protein
MTVKPLMMNGLQTTESDCEIAEMTGIRKSLKQKCCLSVVFQKFANMSKLVQAPWSLNLDVKGLKL